MPPVFVRLVDDAAVFPPGSAPLPDAVSAHRGHRVAWYRELVGPLLVPASALPDLPALLGPGERLRVGVIGDTGVDGLGPAVDGADGRLDIAQVEVAVAKRGEDPQPGLRQLLTLLVAWSTIPGYAEIPLTWGLLGALDTLAEARAAGADVSAKFRTGGVAAELFPTPMELAAVICACRDRRLPFKLTAGLHHAVRHTDTQTGLTHHGFLNVLVATAAASEGAEVAEVAELLGCTDPAPLVDAVQPWREHPRPLWVGYGSCSIEEPLTDLTQLRLISEGAE